MPAPISIAVRDRKTGKIAHVRTTRRGRVVEPVKVRVCRSCYRAHIAPVDCAAA